MARLKPGVNLKQAQASLNVVAQRIAEQHPDSDKGISIGAFPEQLSRPDPDPDNSLSAVAATFMILAALVLLVACFNVLKMVLRQGIPLVAIGLLIGLVAAFAGTHFLADLFYGVTPADPATYAVVATLLLVVALLACWIPARRATQISPLVALRFE